MQRLGENALCAKSDIKSAFRLLPIYPGSFDLLGIQLNGNFYIDKMLPMGLSQSCSYFEKCSSFTDWAVKRESNSDCQVLLDNFSSVPLTIEKTIAPTTIIEYLGLTIDTGKMIVKIQ